MKGRENYLCRKRWKDFQKRILRKQGGKTLNKITRLQAWLSKTKFGDRTELDFLSDNDPLWGEINSKSDLCLGQKCPYYKDCFITILRQEAAKANIVIVNHHLFFSDLHLKETTPSEVLPRYQGVILDEAHQLEDIATEYFGLSVSNYQIQILIRDTTWELEQSKIKNPDLVNTLNLLNQRSGAFFMNFAPHLEKKRMLPGQLSDSILEKLQNLSNAFTLLCTQLEGLKSKPETLFNCLRRCKELHKSLNFIMDLADPSFVYWVESKTRTIHLHASPIDTSQELKRLLFDKMNRLILTSATLSVDGIFEYIKSRLGISNCQELIFKSHFDYSKQSMIYVPTHLPVPNHANFITKMAEEIERIVLLSRGRAFLLFTSYKNLEEIYQFLQGKLPYRILKQGDKPKINLLMEFKKDLHSILMATTSFWEGVDVQGEALSCVIIDKLPFSVPTEPLVEARIDYLNKIGENPFLGYQIPKAIITLRQGLGRLIRNQQDHGLLCILDQRLLTRSYGKIFLKNLPDCPIIKNLDQSKKLLGE